MNNLQWNKLLACNKLCNQSNNNSSNNHSNSNLLLFNKQPCQKLHLPHHKQWQRRHRLLHNPTE
jgi:hypothetical protein